jgi:hypothetical protein
MARTAAVYSLALRTVLSPAVVFPASDTPPPARSSLTITRFLPADDDLKALGRRILVGGIAIALQHSVKWDPAKEEFPGDDQANRLLSYTTRSPWRL